MHFLSKIVTARKLLFEMIRTESDSKRRRLYQNFDIDGLDGTFIEELESIEPGAEELADLLIGMEEEIPWISPYTSDIRSYLIEALGAALKLEDAAKVLQQRKSVHQLMSILDEYDFGSDRRHINKVLRSLLG